jgi:hypothetical protein
MKSPEFLHPEVFDNVWQQWSLNCLEAEQKAGKSLTDKITNDLWMLAVKTVKLRCCLASEQFKVEYRIGVYK